MLVAIQQRYVNSITMVWNGLQKEYGFDIGDDSNDSASIDHGHEVVDNCYLSGGSSKDVMLVWEPYFVN